MKLFYLSLFIVFSVALNQNVFPETKMTTVEYLWSKKYPYQEHKIKTDDGYILHYVRLQSKNFTSIQNNLPVVFMQHGLLDSSDGFVLLNTEEKSPALVLANSGFDVWLGNTRGNRYSMDHVNLTTDSSNMKFWDFSFEEMGVHDIPAAFQYIAEKTGAKKIDYIGHSQGTTQMFVSLSLAIPTVTSLIGKYIALAPVTSALNSQLGFVRIITKPEKEFMKIATRANVYEFQPYHDSGEEQSASQKFLCALLDIDCGNVSVEYMDANPDLDDLDRLEIVGGHVPAGTSCQNMGHWGQLANTGEFQRYDYGQYENEKRYGDQFPPMFPLENIQTPTFIFSGETDQLADPIDVDILYNTLQEHTPVTWIRTPNGHGTFLLGKDMSYINDMIKILKNEPLQHSHIQKSNQKFLEKY